MPVRTSQCTLENWFSLLRERTDLIQRTLVAEYTLPCVPFFQEVDPKAGGGCTMTIGQMVRSFLLKLEWYGTLFPRIPVPVQKDLEAKLRSKGLCDDHKRTAQEGWGEAEDFVKRTRDER